MAVGVDRLAVEVMAASDWPAVSDVYRQGLDTGDASFETDVPGYDEWDRAHLGRPRLVATEAVRRGVGRRLLTELVRRAETEGIWTIHQAGMFPENTAGLRLRERCGFRVVRVVE